MRFRCTIPLELRVRSCSRLKVLAMVMIWCGLVLFVRVEVRELVRGVMRYGTVEKIVRKGIGKLIRRCVGSSSFLHKTSK